LVLSLPNLVVVSDDSLRRGDPEKRLDYPVTPDNTNIGTYFSC
jgi:hypothetical protein